MARESATVVEPLTISSLGANKVKVFCFGKPDNWGGYHLKNFAGRQEITARLKPFLDRISTIWCPDARGFTGRIHFDPIAFHIHGDGEWRVGDTFQAEGTFLQPGEAGFLATGDCPTIVAHCQNAGHTIFAHAGLDSLIDRKWLLTGQRTDPGLRPFSSVVDAIMDHFRLWKRELEILICCGIGTDHFTFPIANHQRAKENMRLLEEVGGSYGASWGSDDLGYISLDRIIRSQFQVHDLELDQIRSDHQKNGEYLDTYADKRFWSHRRWFDQGRVGEDGRNGILIVRRD